MFEDWSTSEKVMAAFLGLLLMVGFIENAPALLVLLVIFGFLYGSSRRQQQEFTTYEDEQEADNVIFRESEPIRRERPATAEQIHQHALKAVRRAGLNPNELAALPVNIGILAFHGDAEPVIHTTRPIDDDCDYIQPFVELRVPKLVTGKIRFEMIDSTGQKVFVHEENHQLERGRNLIIPAARLPVHDELELDGRWEMRVIAGNMILARHLFEWFDTEASGISPHIGEDGEMSSEMRAVLAESRLQRMSLDELLSEQEEEPSTYEEQQQRQRRQN